MTIGCTRLVIVSLLSSFQMTLPNILKFYFIADHHCRCIIDQVLQYQPEIVDLSLYFCIFEFDILAFFPASDFGFAFAWDYSL